MDMNPLDPDRDEYLDEHITEAGPDEGLHLRKRSDEASDNPEERDDSSQILPPDIDPSSEAVDPLSGQI